MLDFKTDRINYEILSFDEKVELLIRGEEEVKNKGIIITDKSIDELKKIIAIIEDFNYSKLISYLKENGIYYNEIDFN